MPAYTPLQRSTPEELERRVRAAWDDYRDSVQTLAGREYEEAEAKAWARLQRRLAEIRR